MPETILVADIGGTNTRFRIFSVSGFEGAELKNGQQAPGTLLFKKAYQNQGSKSFTEIASAFLRESNVSSAPIAACFAVAGPVANNRVCFTNINWELDGANLSKELGIKSVLLVNDFVAQGYGLLTLDEEKECHAIQKAPKQFNAPIACIGAGTGLGECYLTPVDDKGAYHCFPSEGGHAEFAPRSELEFGMLTYLKRKFQHQHRISVERVVSGTGLANVYEYLSTLYPAKVKKDIHTQIQAAGDMKGAVIATNQSKCTLCKQTMELFVTAYGSEAGVAALKWLPFGGLYLTGGLTPKNIDLIKDPQGPFYAAFKDKGRVKGMLDAVPVFAVLVEDLGERGAHYVAFKEYKKVKHAATIGRPDFNLHLGSVTAGNLTLASVLALGMVALGSFLLGYDHGEVVVENSRVVFNQGKDIVVKSFAREKEILLSQLKHLKAFVMGSVRR